MIGMLEKCHVQVNLLLRKFWREPYVATYIHIFLVYAECLMLKLTVHGFCTTLACGCFIAAWHINVQSSELVKHQNDKFSRALRALTRLFSVIDGLTLFSARFNHFYTSDLSSFTVIAHFAARWCWQRVSTFQFRHTICVPSTIDDGSTPLQDCVVYSPIHLDHGCNLHTMLHFIW